MDLFIRPSVEFEKMAAEVELPEDPNTWPKEILDELYKQVPYIADFHPHVVMQQVDAERRYGMGFVEIANQSETQMGTDPAMVQASGVRSVRIPVVVHDGKLYPFDLLVNDASNVLPLTESRLRQAIFRPQAFDVTSQTPGDQSMIGQLYPPYRQNYGFGGGGVTTPGMGKTGSALEDFLTKGASSCSAPAPSKSPKAALKLGKQKVGSVLQAILPTINQTDLDGFWQKVGSDLGLRAQFRKNAASNSRFLGMLAELEPTTATKTASILPSLIKPSVVQVSRDSGSYMVKSASHLFWRPFTQHIDRGELVQRFGVKVAMDVDQAGAVTIADGAEAEAPEAPQAALITESGFYKVRTEDGRELIGFVIPNLIDTDGEALPLASFTNGSHATVQSEIHGEKAGDGVNLPVGPAMGMGMFFTTTPHGLQATIPMTLHGSHEMGGEPGTFVGETFDGRPVEVSVQPNIQVPMGTPDGKLLLPATWQWSPMEKCQNVALVGSEDTFGGDESVETGGEEEGEEKPKQANAYVTIRSDGTTFSFSGPAVEKLAYAERSFLDIDDAMFLLAGLGVEQGHGAVKLAHATTGTRGEVVKVGRLLKLASDAHAEALGAARDYIAHLPALKVDLVKEASMIPDPMAVDTVLSLGFINPENVMTFISYLPRIDDAQQRMCELLLAARLGLQNIPASALERAVRSTEEAIEGLKVIAFSE